MWAGVGELPVTTVGGRKCYYYDVKSSQSIYSVSNELGLTREQIVEFNPTAADGLKPRMRLYFPVDAFQVPVEERPVVYAAATGVTTHVVKRGESVYGIARKYGMTSDEIVALNPQVNEGVYEGQVLKIVEDAPQADVAIMHTIADGETLYQIASRYHTSIEAILAANPNLDALRYVSGQTVKIPVGNEPLVAPVTSRVKVESVKPDGGALRQDRVDDESLSPIETIQLQVAEAPADTLRVAIMLPFMLDEPTQTRTTELYTEFFKGMLMAADEMHTDGLQPVKFSFFDTSASLERVNDLLRNPGVLNSDMIISPDNADQINAILNRIDNKTLVLNIFAVKDENYLTHPNVIQMNTPSPEMYRKAVDAFMKEFSGSTPVFISRIGGQADKEAFVTELKSRLDAEEQPYREIIFSGILRDADLAELNPDENPLVFVPVTGSKSEFAKYVQAITNLREGADNPKSVKLWGYPEWVTFRSESYDELSNLDATIYSRFLVDDHDFKANELKRKYHAMYGVEIFDAVPAQGILGYDAAKFAVNGLRQQSRNGSFPLEFNGVQNCLTLQRAGVNDSQLSASGSETISSGGLFNNLLFLIHFRPGGVIESKKL